MADIAEQGFPQATDVAVSPPPPPPPPPPPGGQVTAPQLSAAGEQTRVKVGAGI